MRATSAERTRDLLARVKSATQRVGQRQALCTRPGMVTSLALVQEGHILESDVWWRTVLPILSYWGQLTRLRLAIQHTPQPFLDYMAEVLPGLQSLTLGTAYPGTSISGQLPPPKALPDLREITVHRVPMGSQRAVWAGMAQYITQLQRLSIKAQPAKAVDEATQLPMWHVVFNTDHVTRSLTHLDLPVRLTPDLAGLLQDFAPMLQDLSVAEISAASHSVEDAPQDAPCLWRTLRFTQDGRIRADALLWLPLPAEGKLVIVHPDVANKNEDGALCPLDVELPVTDTVSDCPLTTPQSAYAHLL